MIVMIHRAVGVRGQTIAPLSHHPHKVDIGAKHVQSNDPTVLLSPPDF